MHQLESPANLDRISDPRIRLLVGILIRTGLRIGDATRLALDCLIRDRRARPICATATTRCAAKRSCPSMTSWPP